MSRPASFLDRDGTLVQPRHMPTRPEHLVLYPEVPAELSRLQHAGFCIVVITNHSGIARGLLTEAALATLNAYLNSQLASHGIVLDGIYWCPHHLEGTVARLAVDCMCRKPRPGLILEAARELDIDLTRSWFVGDHLDDIDAGKRAGCRTVLVDLHAEPPPARSDRTPHYVGRSTVHAIAAIQAVERLGPPADLTYQPDRWQQTARENLLRAAPDTANVSPLSIQQTRGGVNARQR